MTNESDLLLTDHELLALLAMNPTQSSASTRDVFRLGGVPHQDVLERAGITTLLARGMAEPSGDDIIPAERGALVAAVLTTATAWLEVAFVTPAADHVMFVAASEHGSLLLSLNRLGAHQVRPVDTSEGLAHLGVLLTKAYLQDATDGLPAAAMVTHHALSETSRTAHLKRDEDETWTLQTGQGEAAQTATVPAATAFELFSSALV
ncbi:hypothetical protein SAMN04489740_3819 [Arthrobacter alpinus]|uniref:Uncharacterized protein n=1 Tax=Arthrobacter alpinus TaxID=656366 RepID=A0A1H5NNM4_9MICC|nr:hypothetical protein [Arthrobacter alpinus]SEF02407.1 hypothetical protein SAMN04489740_3819 [Arthrobacter alpinus]